MNHTKLEGSSNAINNKRTFNHQYEITILNQTQLVVVAITDNHTCQRVHTASNVGPADSSAAQLIENAGVGMWAEDHESIVESLVQLATQGIPYSPRDSAIRPYSADTMAERTARLLDRVIESHQD